MGELQSVARLKIHDGKLDEFKRLAAKCAELVRTKDTGTLQYEQYINSDNTECLVIERYRDSQALLEVKSVELINYKVSQKRPFTLLFI
jgi:quinol monooxygenase YgiN